MNWTSGMWDVHQCKIGAFTVTVQPHDGAYAAEIGCVRSKQRWLNLDDAKREAIELCKRQLKKALDACEEMGK